MAVIPVDLFLGAWRPVEPLLFCVLVVAAVVGEASEARLANGIRLDSTTATGLVALALWGAGPAFLVMVSPVVVWSLLGPSRRPLPGIPGQLRSRWRRLRRPGNVSNCASYGWSLIAAGAWLSLVQHVPMTSATGIVVGLMPAGMIASASQFALGPCVHETTWNHYSIKEVLKPTLKAAPVDLLMLLAGSVIAFLTLLYGLPALTLLAIVVLLPPLIPAAARPQAIGTRDQAVRLYAQALACAVGATREERRTIRAVLDGYQQIQRSGLLREIETTETLDPATLKSLLHHDSPVYAAWTVSEHLDGSGPCRLAGPKIPMQARIVAVAERLAELTADDGDRLELPIAVRRIALQAGQHFDPAVIAAAELIAIRESRFNEAVSEYQGATVLRPSLHRLPLLRTVLLGRSV